jgi:hypothetical protein
MQFIFGTLQFMQYNAFAAPSTSKNGESPRQGMFTLDFL